MIFFLFKMKTIGGIFKIYFKIIKNKYLFGVFESKAVMAIFRHPCFLTTAQSNLISAFSS